MFILAIFVFVHFGLLFAEYSEDVICVDYFGYQLDPAACEYFGISLN